MSATDDIGRRLATDDPERLREQLRARARGSLYFFAKAILGYRDLTPRFHRELCAWLQASPFQGGRYLVEIFRGGLKTSIVTVAWTLHELIQYRVRSDGVVTPRSGHFGPLARFILVGGSQLNISEVLANRIQPKFYPGGRYWLFHWLFPEIIPPNFRDEVWNTTVMTVPRPYNPEGPTIVTLGVGSKIEGKRANRLIEDDVYGREASGSEVQTQDIIGYHQLCKPILENPMRDEHVTVGNRWAFQDLNGYILENEQITRHFRKAILECECHPQGPPCDLAEPVWPERFDWEAIKRLQAEMTIYQFSCQMLNSPADPENKPFRLEHLRYYEWVTEAGPEGKLRLCDSDVIVDVGTLMRVGCCDPARSPSKHSDRSALVAVGTDYEHRIILLDAVAKRVEPVQLANDMLDFHTKWQFARFGVETIAYQYMLKNYLEQDLCERRGIWLPLVGLDGQTRVKKDSRITYVIGQRAGAGQLYVNKAQQNFIQEYIWYPDKTYPRDILDAFAYCDQLWFFPVHQTDALARAYEDEQVERRRRALGAGGY